MRQVPHLAFNVLNAFQCNPGLTRDAPVQQRGR
jgi:hypothetical protein